MLLLIVVILEGFTSLTGAALRSDGIYRVDRYAHGGMSNGMVCGHAWVEWLLPALRQRARFLRDEGQSTG